MSVSEPFVRRPVGSSLLAAGILLLGAVAYHFLPVAPLPKVDFPTINVSAQEPGVDPATAASSLAAPLERRFAQIAGVTEITSVSSLGGSNITIQFDLNRDSTAPRAMCKAQSTPRPVNCRPGSRNRRRIGKLTHPTRRSWFWR